eukprot:TRINITY_DN1997_c0_g1_i18.p1 TRINITY_DN1997_c0_g1~~TRINITY_DN1997_c0_g1_i18.p1  ORF type:complete len:685 (+),score=147.18 TRINITY_DN1997_c0_g1_i18:1414-3468(+)
MQWTLAKVERFMAVSISGTPNGLPAPPAPTPDPVPTGATGPALSVVAAGNTYARFVQFINTLTTLETGGTRAVHSSGGAVGGVVSEGQGYGLLLGGVTAASLGVTHTNFNWTIGRAYELFVGWKRMCMLSAATGSCQSQFMCTVGTTGYPCLPHWKFDDRLNGALGTGSASDGDEDAILGMILLVLATKGNKPSWWNEVAKWAYQSSKQFYESNTVANAANTARILKLGACWGGWDCNNPSYHAPGTFRVIRDYMKNWSSTLGFGAEGTSYLTKWNLVINTTYDILNADQCKTTGLTTNWYVPNANPALVGSTGCSGSGTPASEYGAEASRGVWRVTIDWLWYSDEDTIRPARYLDPVARHLISKNTGGTTFNNLDTGCLVTSILSPWSTFGFMYGPTFSSLVYPTQLANQTSVLNAAASILSSATISDYYAGSWIAIATMTLNGDLARLKPLLRGTTTTTTPTPTSSPPTTPSPTTPTSATSPTKIPTPATSSTKIPTPTTSSTKIPTPATSSTKIPTPATSSTKIPTPATPPTTSTPSPTTGSCLGVAYRQAPANGWWVAVVAPAPPSTLTVKCGTGPNMICTYDSGWRTWSCNHGGLECVGTRTAVLGNLNCVLSVIIPAVNVEAVDEIDTNADPSDDGLVIPVWAIVIIAVVGTIIVVAVTALTVTFGKAPAAVGVTERV